MPSKEARDRYEHQTGQNPQQQSRESLLFEILWSLIAFPFSSTGLKVKLSFIEQIWNSSEATQESYHYCGKENNNSSLYQNKRTIIVLFTPKRESYHYCGQENACQYIYIFIYNGKENFYEQEPSTKVWRLELGVGKYVLMWCARNRKILLLIGSNSTYFSWYQENFLNKFGKL